MYLLDTAARCWLRSLSIYILLRIEGLHLSKEVGVIITIGLLRLVESRPVELSVDMVINVHLLGFLVQKVCLIKNIPSTID